VTFTTCRDLALKLDAAGVPVEHRREHGISKWFYPQWAARAQGLIRDSRIPKPLRRKVLAALAADGDRREALDALVHVGEPARVRLFLESLAVG
jgi:hypothetical protein